MSRLSTGLCDSEGLELFIGDHVRIESEINQDVHGSWTEYEIKQQGLTPILLYVTSEKGQSLPKGITGSPLSLHYDQELFCSEKNSFSLRPEYSITKVLK